MPSTRKLTGATRTTSSVAAASQPSSPEAGIPQKRSNSRLAERIRTSKSFLIAWFRRPGLDVAENILRLRRLRGMSQEELAETMATRQPAVARLEGGKSNPRLDTLTRVAEALDAVVRVQFLPVEEIGAGAFEPSWWYWQPETEQGRTVVIPLVWQTRIGLPTSQKPESGDDRGEKFVPLTVGELSLPWVEGKQAKRLVTSGV